MEGSENWESAIAQLNLLLNIVFSLISNTILSAFSICFDYLTKKKTIWPPPPPTLSDPNVISEAEHFTIKEFQTYNTTYNTSISHITPKTC
mgnify:CR=1 FL=1